MPMKDARLNDLPPGKGLVSGQRLAPGIRQRAKELRSTMTAAETALWADLRRDSLDGLHFRRQQIIDGYIVDFYCHSAGLVVEVDGPVHEGQTEYDVERDACLASRGLVVLRIPNQDVERNLQQVLHRIRAAAACHGGRQTEPPGSRTCPPTPRPPNRPSPPTPFPEGEGGESAPLPSPFRGGKGSGDGRGP
jgi:very-short-patch-repair endonuclease